MQSRYYNPEWGRFLNADSVYDLDAGLQGYNIFLYCANNPVNRIDISGANSTTLEEGTEDILDAMTLDGGGNSTFSCGSLGNSGKAYCNAANPIDAGYHYGVDLSQASNSSSFSGGISTNGYKAYSYYTDPANNAVSSQASNPLTDIIYTEKVLRQMQGDDFHGFSPMVDNYGALGKLTLEQGKDGNMYNNLRIPGSYLGHDGVFHYIWDSRGICNHRQFTKI